MFYLLFLANGFSPGAEGSDPKDDAFDTSFANGHFWCVDDWGISIYRDSSGMPSSSSSSHHGISVGHRWLPSNRETLNMAGNFDQNATIWLQLSYFDQILSGNKSEIITLKSRLHPRYIIFSFQVVQQEDNEPIGFWMIWSSSFVW